MIEQRLSNLMGEYQRKTGERLTYRDLAEGQGTFQERARKLREIATSDHVREIVDFILAASDRSFLTPRV